MADGTIDINAKPTEEISVREVFGIDTDMVVHGFPDRTDRVPDLDSTYKFDPDTTLAILAGFRNIYWDMKKTQFSSSASDATGFSPFGEVGINYHLSSNVRLSTGYQYIDSVGKSNVGRYDSYGLLVSVAYTLGGPTQAVLVETAPTPIVVDIPVKDSVIVKTPRQTQIFSPKTTSELFGFDSIELSDESIEQLTEVLSVLITYPQAKVVVVGHTDSVGSASYNQKLSERRAQAVVNKLIELGVTSTRLEWQGKGEYQPIADNKTAKGRAENRRVEISIPSFPFQE